MSTITVNSRLRLEQPAVGRRPRWQIWLRAKTRRKRVVRLGLVAFNTLLLVAAAGFIVANRLHDTEPVVQASAGSAAGKADAAIADPLDRLSSADIAVNIARMTSLPEATAVTNQADSENAQLAVAQTSDSLVAKPQVVATAFKSNKDIRSYTAAANDTVASLAAKFGVTSDSILWSNSLLTNEISPGQKLYIPPVNGIVYLVAAGDTPEALAQKYHTTKEKIIAYNDAEISGLKPGERIIIPDGQQPGPANRSAVRSVATGGGGYGASFPWGSSPIYGYNGYDYGYCTYYVASRISVPTNWGNANTWDNLAPQSGWSVSTAPSVGAIGQTDRGAEGHVAVVEAVSPDGQMIKYSDMNGLAGWGNVGHSGWTSVSKFEHYITR